MALPVRRNGETATTRRDPFADIERLNRQLQGYLDSWSNVPSLLGDGFDADRGSSPLSITEIPQLTAGVGAR
jgi:hypothetical protein